MKVSSRGAVVTAAPVHSTFSHFSLLLFDVVSPNLFSSWQTNERSVHGWQFISLAGGKQLDTANRGWRGSDMKSMRQSCKCGQEPLCKSISKIIHFAAATHFRLPLSIKDVSGEDDGWLRCGAWPLLFNLSSTPRRPPPSKLSSFHIPLHLFPYSSSSPQPSSATACIKEKGGPIVAPDPLGPLLSLWGLNAKNSDQLSGFQRKGLVLVCAKQTYITLWKMIISKLYQPQETEFGGTDAWNPCRSRFVNTQIQKDYCVVLSNPGI